MRTFNARAARLVCTLFGACLALTACTFGNQRATYACYGTNAYLSNLPVLTRADYKGVIPMGYSAPVEGDVFPSDRVYFQPWSDDPMAVPPTYNVFNVVSPADDLEILAIATRYYSTSSVYDHTLLFRPCSGLRVYLQHISTFDADFAAKLSAANSSWNNGTGGVCLAGTDEWGGNYDECVSRFPDVTMSARELIGTAGKYRPLGYGLYDSTVTNAYLTPEYYSLSFSFYTNLLGITVDTAGAWEFLMPAYRDYLHSTCPFSRYPGRGVSGFPAVSFTDSQGNALGSWNENNCGGFVEDSALGGASGNWFLTDVLDILFEGDGLSYLAADTTAIALVHDSIHRDSFGQTDFPVFSIGSSIPITGGVVGTMNAGRYSYTVSNAGTTNRDFRNLQYGTEYCFSSLSRADGGAGFTGVIRLKADDAHTLTFEAFGGGAVNCGNTALDAQALDFVR
jgi:hypothetical protein